MQRKNQNWRQKNTSLCFSLNSKIQILVCDWAPFYWLLPIGYSSFSPPFLPSKAFQFEFKLSLSNSPVDYNSASYWSKGWRSQTYPFQEYYKYTNFLIFNKYIFFGWGDCANFSLTGTAKGFLPTPRAPPWPYLSYIQSLL